MAATFTNYFLNQGVQPLYPWESREQVVALGPSLTLAAGTVVGEIQLTDTYSLATGSQASGTFTLTYEGVTTAAIARNATAATVQAALVAISTIGTGNMTVALASGTPGTDAVYTITFAGDLAYASGGTTALGLLTLDAALLATPGNASLTHSVTGQALGTFTDYDNAATDGTQHAKGVLRYDCATDSSGNITFGTAATGGPYQQTSKSAPVYTSGSFRTEDLTGLDANAVTDLGRLTEGTIVTGILRMP